jgi:hypothetical protein
MVTGRDGGVKRGPVTTTEPRQYVHEQGVAGALEASAEPIEGDFVCQWRGSKLCGTVDIRAAPIKIRRRLGRVFAERNIKYECDREKSGGRFESQPV